ncbi:MAG: YbaB/EbfC family nucleoid-associated protein [Maricaulis sp.]|uniref:YbaB/EbfC family nucleoid-associated protein n=1 Tax=Maricaulis sp. TaxID=1486257 RepID=UPI001B2A18EC|nr:YbaB/EbfC family nucleoid-associated protein [Maricaulis sp.]MBO6730012.1 YbaB/EbfC family nucleoid-associated protein [Maricaulis sp.]MBO6848814.1 YbaB/EbfC family nucleoid-associated protein [Maricaulis sp.]MBO6878860.1 YbaB/EbfC family nucleoid-associated protein [Maricaulis sp.]MDM7985650.1 YbaB/EbfC family nucleoid-associated protein [Maricaulis sp.]
MKDLMGLMKQAQAMQEKMAEAQAALDEAQVTGESGGGMVAVTLTAKGDMKALRIDPTMIDPSEPEILEDLILAAHNEARRKAEDKQKELMQDATSGLQLPPGMSLPF